MPQPATDDVDASLLELPSGIRDRAIEAWLTRRDRPPINPGATIETYFRCDTTVAAFNEVFPLGKIFKKWKDGIPLFPKVKHSVGAKSRHTCGLSDAVIKNLLEAGIISPASGKSAFRSSFFLVPKSNGKSVRPIFNYSHLSKHLKSHHFKLPSVFQVIRENPWPVNLYYCKLDLSAAFFNIPLKESSKFITTLEYGGKLFVANKLPMGLSLAPFVMQRFANAIAQVARLHISYVWAHIDDILLADKCPTRLAAGVKLLLGLLASINWRISAKKSVLVPTRSIIYLGARWSSRGVQRLPEVTARLSALWSYMITNSYDLHPLHKPVQRIRGLFNYYFSFAGFFHAVTNRVVIAASRRQYHVIIAYLLKQDFISFKHHLRMPEVHVFSDASLYAIAAVLPKFTFSQYSPSSSIAMNELRAAILAIRMFCSLYNKTLFVLHLWVDNLNVLFLLSKGSCHWNIPTFFLFQCIKLFSSLHCRVSYIPSALNPADAPSRSQAYNISGVPTDFLSDNIC